ncbi:unnamed protein product [[Actinomadura] parvosata subsp. kistnae]|uniref:hypothetical protein n=1 Tax=[Actinomadura] parvosata TaxID=1955412 RepID=UPI000D28E929|nr:hypothetical protein [Nonomuraea sp. ATCC 55076]SPL88623.1 unnamed protein product [Actinomadura parvosata subsp. kistnae]
MADAPKNRSLHCLELVTGFLEDKKRRRHYKARVEGLPDGYRAAQENRTTR